MKRFRREDPLGRELRESGPQVSDDFVRSLAGRVDPGARRTHLYTASRLSFVSAVAVLIVGTFASFGGLGYAAASATHVVNAAKDVVAPDARQVPQSAAQDQYAQPKVKVCHNGHTITIAQAALPAHLRHGDTEGACPAGAVAGANASGGHGAVLGATGSSGSLPFTGVSLGATVLLALILITCGIALRRRAARSS